MDVLLEMQEPVARIVINRPERMNALRMTITDRELIEALEQCEREKGVKVVVTLPDDAHRLEPTAEKLINRG